MSNQDIYIGIDPTAGRRPFSLAALNDDLRPIAFEATDIDGTVAFVERWPHAVVAVDAPQSPNRGLMRQAGRRRSYGLNPKSRTFAEWKVCEYELRRRNLRVYSTPSRAAEAPLWMRVGFDLYRRLRELGFEFHRLGENADGPTIIEVHPHACFAVLLGHRPLAKASLEGRLQRQMTLYIEGVDVANPLHVLEEISRHHLLSGELPLEGLHSHDELDALIAAYTAFLVHQKPTRLIQLGDPEEGLITLPAAALKDHYA
jgi:predicted nuclease with RNAse H fold